MIGGEGHARIYLATTGWGIRKGTVLSSRIASATHGATIVEVFSKAPLAAKLVVRVASKVIAMDLSTFAN